MSQYILYIDYYWLLMVCFGNMFWSICFVLVVLVVKTVKLKDVSSVECVRVGEHDAALIIDIAKSFDKVCENGKQLNEEWVRTSSKIFAFCIHPHI